jgi:hypothetical protein
MDRCFASGRRTNNVYAGREHTLLLINPPPIAEPRSFSLFIGGANRKDARDGGRDTETLAFVISGGRNDEHVIVDTGANGPRHQIIGTARLSRDAGGNVDNVRSFAEGKVDGMGKGDWVEHARGIVNHRHVNHPTMGRDALHASPVLAQHKARYMGCVFNCFRDHLFSVCPVAIDTPEISPVKTRVGEIYRTVENGDANTRISACFFPKSRKSWDRFKTRHFSR